MIIDLLVLSLFEKGSHSCGIEMPWASMPSAQCYVSFMCRPGLNCRAADSRAPFNVAVYCLSR